MGTGKKWAFATLIAGGLILLAEIWFWVSFFLGYEFARLVWNTDFETQVGLVVEAPIAIVVGTIMIAGSAGVLAGTGRKAILLMCLVIVTIVVLIGVFFAVGLFKSF